MEPTHRKLFHCHRSGAVATNHNGSAFWIKISAERLLEDLWFVPLKREAPAELPLVQPPFVADSRLILTVHNLC